MFAFKSKWTHTYLHMSVWLSSCPFQARSPFFPQHITLWKLTSVRKPNQWRVLFPPDFPYQSQFGKVFQGANNHGTFFPFQRITSMAPPPLILQRDNLLPMQTEPVHRTPCFTLSTAWLGPTDTQLCLVLPHPRWPSRTWAMLCQFLSLDRLRHSLSSASQRLGLFRTTSSVHSLVSDCSWKLPGSLGTQSSRFSPALCGEF